MLINNGEPYALLPVHPFINQSICNISCRRSVVIYSMPTTRATHVCFSRRRICCVCSSPSRNCQHSSHAFALITGRQRAQGAAIRRVMFGFVQPSACVACLHATLQSIDLHDIVQCTVGPLDIRLHPLFLKITLARCQPL